MFGNWHFEIVLEPRRVCDVHLPSLYSESFNVRNVYADAILRPRASSQLSGQERGLEALRAEGDLERKKVARLHSEVRHATLISSLQAVICSEHMASWAHGVSCMLPLRGGVM